MDPIYFDIIRNETKTINSESIRSYSKYFDDLYKVNEDSKITKEYKISSYGGEIKTIQINNLDQTNNNQKVLKNFQLICEENTINSIEIEFGVLRMEKVYQPFLKSRIFDHGVPVPHKNLPQILLETSEFKGKRDFILKFDVYDCDAYNSLSEEFVSIRLIQTQFCGSEKVKRNAKTKEQLNFLNEIPGFFMTNVNTDHDIILYLEKNGICEKPILQKEYFVDLGNGLVWVPLVETNQLDHINDMVGLNVNSFEKVHLEYFTNDCCLSEIFTINFNIMRIKCGYIGTAFGP